MNAKQYSHCFVRGGREIMKRYFQPVEKDGSFKKHKEKLTANPSNSSPPTSNGTTLPPSAEKEDGVKKEPLKFMSWNANSLLLRLKKNRTELADFVQRLDPDVIAIQEVRIPAAGGKGGSKNQGELKDDTSSAREEKQTLMRALSCPPFSNYRVWWSLGDTKYAGTALFVKHGFQPLKVTFSLDQTGSSALKHEVDGRVIVAEFEAFRLLNSYVPNNGWKDDETGFRRRRKWDQRMLDFVLRVSDKPLIWCGDLNVRPIPLFLVECQRSIILQCVWEGELPCWSTSFTWAVCFLAGPNLCYHVLLFSFTSSTVAAHFGNGDYLSVSHEDIDVSHPEFFSSAKAAGYVPPNKEDCGQPGFTITERRRFSTILSQGKLLDTYRWLHKEPENDRGYTWSGNPVGKYRGKRMRIDYFLLPETFKHRIVASNIHGHGIEMEGFLGSDHCPISLELSPMQDVS